MSTLSTIVLASLVALPASSADMNEARMLVENQLQAAAAATALLEEKKLPAAAKAERLLPLAAELARLHAQRQQVDAQQLAEEEERAAADASVQRLALRLLRAIELCAASDYAGSIELKSAVHRLALAIEGESPEPGAETASPVDVSPAASAPAAGTPTAGLTGQNGAG